ncbi:MAG TPA: efflux RND transporter periplasmic adaptor subunit [Candidatus Binatia bacterium]|nr:efflux RND transporter periplasmic adaptor subunit [Candidatus Binatia bacterium]
MTRAALLLAVALAACGGGEREEPPREASVPGLETAAATTAAVHDVVHAFGAVTAEPVPPEVRDAEAQLADAEAKHRLAAEQLRRAEDLQRGAVAPRKELEAARADEASSAAAVARARAAVASFGTAAPRAPLGADEAWVMAQLVQQEIGRVDEHAAAKVVMDAFPGRTFAGEVDAVPAYVDPASRTAPVRLRVKDPEHVLRPGMTGAVAMEVGRVREAVLVPAAAVVRDGTTALVFVEEAPGRYVPHPVALGVARDAEVEVASGVPPGARVVTTGAASLLSAARLPAGGEEE